MPRLRLIGIISIYACSRFLPCFHLVVLRLSFQDDASSILKILIFFDPCLCRPTSFSVPRSCQMLWGESQNSWVAPCWVELTPLFSPFVGSCPPCIHSTHARWALPVCLVLTPRCAPALCLPVLPALLSQRKWCSTASSKPSFISIVIFLNLLSIPLTLLCAHSTSSSTCLQKL